MQKKSNFEILGYYIYGDIMKKYFLFLFLLLISLLKVANLLAKETDEILKLSNELISPNVILVDNNDSNEQRKHLFLNSFCFIKSENDYANLKRSTSIKDYYLKNTNVDKINLNYKYNLDSETGLIISAEIIYNDTTIKEIPFMEKYLFDKPFISGPKEITYSYGNRMLLGNFTNKFKVISKTSFDEPLKVSVFDGNTEIDNFYKYEPGEYSFILIGRTLTGDIIKDKLKLHIKEENDKIYDLESKTILELGKIRPNEESLKSLYISKIKDLNLDIEKVAVLSTNYKVYDKSKNDSEVLFRITTGSNIYNDLVLIKKDEIKTFTTKHKIIITVTAILVITIIFYIVFPIFLKQMKLAISRKKEKKKENKKEQE